MASTSPPIYYRTDSGNPGGGDLKAALKVLDDVGNAGLALMPLEPSATMIAAGMQIGGITEAEATAVYFAMLAAAAEE